MSHVKSCLHDGIVKGCAKGGVILEGPGQGTSYRRTVQSAGMGFM